MANLDQSKPVSHPLSIIYMQKSNSCATAWSDSFNTRTVKTKMTIPQTFGNRKFSSHSLTTLLPELTMGFQLDQFHEILYKHITFELLALFFSKRTITLGMHKFICSLSYF